MSSLTETEIVERFKNFDKDIMSLIISSVSSEGEPLTSYSPFVKEEGTYYICISSNLPHYLNMTQTKKAHIMLIEDESKASHVYARKRLYFSVECILQEESEKIFTLFDARYGESLSFLREMKDFKIIKMLPQEKSLVLGFGAAYKMQIDGSLANKSISHS